MPDREDINGKISEVQQETALAQQDIDRAEGHLDLLHRTLKGLDGLVSPSPSKTPETAAVCSERGATIVG